MKFFFTVLILSLVLMAGVNLSAQDYVPNQVLVCFQKDVINIEPRMVEGQVQTGMASFDNLCQSLGVIKMERWLTMADERDVDGDIKLMNIYRLQLDGRNAVESALDAFNKNEWLHSAEYEFIENPDVFLAPFQPNDPILPQQWYINKLMADWAWGLWTTFGNTPGDSSIVLGVVDSGVEWDHPDLIANIWVNPGEDIDGDGVVGDFGATSAGGDENGVDDDGNGKIDDLIGWDMIGYSHSVPVEDNNPMATAGSHGTLVSGCASGTANNGIGVAGVGYRIKIMPVKCGADNGNPSVWRATDGVLYAAKSGADVINCSYGNYSYSGYAQSVYNNAYLTYGAIILGSAGNDGINMDLPGNAHYPSNYNNVICVAGTDIDDGINSGSNYGSAVDISSPFSNIRTTDLGHSYTSTQGTSFSSPIAAAAIALLKSMFPDSSNLWLEQQLKAGADNIDAQNPNHVGMMGAGRVNVFNAIGQNLYSRLEYTSKTLQIIDDDGNGVLNPGETASMRITLKNGAGWKVAHNIQTVLRTSETAIQIIDSAAAYNDISGGSIGINILQPFKFKVDSLAGNGDYDFTLYITTDANGILLEQEVPITINVSGFMNGWPIANVSFIQSSPIVYGATPTADKQIFVGSDAGNFYGWALDGTNLPNFPLTLGGQIWGSPALGDLDNNGTEELVIGSSTGHLFVIGLDGTIIHDWNIGEFIYGTPSLADLDNNNDLEIIFGTFSGNIQVLNHDGSSYPNFPYVMSTIDRVMGGCAIADINGDNVLDIVAGTQGKNIYAVDANGTLLSGFPYAAPHSIIGSIIIGDLAGNGSEQIVFGAQDGSLIALNANGSVNFSVNTGGAIRGSVSLCDVDQNGTRELFVTNYNKDIYGYTHDGNVLNGFPLTMTGNGQAQPVFADLYGNGELNMIVAGLDGHMYVYNFATADWAAGSPSPIAGQLKSTPTIMDMDNDGDLEIALGTNNGFAVMDIRQAGGVTENFWHMFQGNNYRSGYYGDTTTDIDTDNAPLILSYQLAQNYPNPFNPSTTIRYQLKSQTQTKLEIFNLLGEKVATLVNGKQAAGPHSVQWNAQSFASGIYIYRLSAGEFSATKRMLLLK